MVCTELGNISTLADLLVYPTGCNYYFYLWIFGALWAIFTFSMYWREKITSNPKPDLISAAGVSTIPIVVLGGIGTVIKNSQDIPLIQQDILLYILAFSIIIWAVWFLTKE